MAQQRRTDYWAALGLFAIVLFVFRDAVFGGRVLYERDIHINWYGVAESFVRSVAVGSWPVWDPWVSFGQPLWADPNEQILYPPTWLNLIMRPWTYYTWYAVSHLTASAIGVYYLGQRFGVSALGSLVAAALWVTGGPFLSLVNLYHHFAGAAWMPWVLLATEKSLDGSRGSLLVLGGVFAAQILAGSADMCAMTVLLVGLLVLRRLEWRPLFGRKNREITIGVSLAFALAAGLTAALWLPALDVLRGSSRLELPREIRTFWSVHPAALVQLLCPISLFELALAPEHRRLLSEQLREPFLLSLYLGGPALALVSVAFAPRRRPFRKTLMLAGIGALVIALGKHGMAYDLAVWMVPPLKIVRYPEKAIIVLALAWALLGGMGFDGWQTGTSRRRFLLTAVLPVITAAVLLAGLGRVSGYEMGVLAPQARALLRAGLLSLAVLVLAMIRSRRPGAALGLTIATALIAVVDLVAQHVQLNPTGLIQLYTTRPPTMDLLKQPDRRRVYVHEYGEDKSLRELGRADAYRIDRFVKDWPPRLSAVMGRRLYMTPPIGGAWSLEGSYDYDTRGLYPIWLSRLIQLARATEGSPAHIRLLRMGAVGRVVALHGAGLDDLVPLSTFAGPFIDPIRVFEVPDSRPRTYAVGDTRVAVGMEALETLMDPGFDPSREVVLPEGMPERARPSFSGTSRILDFKPDHVRIEAELSQAGYVVLVDAYDPGWRATVDRTEVRVMTANVGFRAVAVPSGRHLIEYIYRPIGIKIGILVSIATTLAALFMARSWFADALGRAGVVRAGRSRLSESGRAGPR